MAKFKRKSLAFTPNFRSGGRMGGRKARKSDYLRTKKSPKTSSLVYKSKKVPLSKFNDFIDRVIEINSDGDPVQGIKYLKKTAIPKQLKIKGKKIKVTKPPISGVTSDKNKEIPLTVSESTKMISGTNGLYNAKEHKVTFNSGEPIKGWLKKYVKDNGRVERKLVDTTSTYQIDSTNRTDFTKFIGFNQKFTEFVDTKMFGLEASEMSPFFDINSLDTHLLRDQTAYGACTNAVSKMTITSLNKFVPVYIKLYLCKSNMPAQEWTDARDDLINSTLDTQIDGSMPLYFQQDTWLQHPDTLVGRGINVDPKTRGVRAANKWKSLVDVIDTKTVKLAAGDRLKVVYDHQFGSGVNVTKLHGLVNDSSFDNDMPLAYCLMLEVYGEEVDAYRYTTPNHVIKGTAPACIQFEFEKSVFGCMPSERMLNIIASGSQQGFITSDFGIKIFTKSPLVGEVRRYFAKYEKLTETDGTGIRVPVMSDANPVDVGKIS